MTGACVAVAATQLDVSRLGAVILAGSPALIAVGLLAYCATGVVMAIRWRLMLAVDGVAAEPRFVQEVMFKSFFLGLVLPTSLGGDVYRGAKVVRALSGVERASVNLLAERTLGIWTLSVIGLVGALASAALPSELRWAFLVVTGGVVLALPLVVVGNAAALCVRVLRWGGASKIALVVERVAAQVSGYLVSPRTSLSLLGLTLIQQMLAVVALWLFDVAVEAGAGAGAIAMASPLSWVMGLMPSFGGFGPREGALALLLEMTGALPERAAAVALLGAAAIVVRAMIGGVLLVVHGR